VIHTKINAALSAKLATLNIPTQYENAPFTPTAGVTYLRETYLPAATLAVALAQTDDYSGIYQVMVMAPKDGGKGAGLNTAQTVMAAFPRGLRMLREGHNIAIQQVSQRPALLIGDRWAVVVEVTFRAFK